MTEKSIMLTAQKGSASREKYHFSNLCIISFTDLHMILIVKGVLKVHCILGDICLMVSRM